MPRCADFTCGRWRPERLAPKWAAGLRFNGGWYCSRECVEHAARVGLDTPAVPVTSAGSLPPLKLGVLLRHLGAISESALEGAIEAQRASGRRLGAELVASGLVEPEVVLKALAAQCGVSYLQSFDVNRVMSGPTWLPAETVRALGLVPFEADERQKRLRVISAAPVPRAATRALLKLTGWTAEPYLVYDEIWQDALSLYRPASQETGQRREVDDGQRRRCRGRSRRGQRAARSLGDDARGELRSVHVGAGRRAAAGLRPADPGDPGGAMPGGAYSALSGMRTRLEELDRLAADLANVSTVGYKTERSAKVASERDEFATALESAVDVVMGGKKIDFKPGLIASTGRDLDVAIDGSGFFAIETPAGERYTRNGSFSRRADGTLTTSTGETVLGESGPITLPNGPVSIGDDGTITSGTTDRGSFASRAIRVRERPDQGIGSDLQSFSRRDAGAGGSQAGDRVDRAVEREHGGPDGEAHRADAQLRVAQQGRDHVDERPRRTGHLVAGDEVIVGPAEAGAHDRSTSAG